MLLGELPSRLEDEFSYPVELDTVIEQVGAVRVEDPDGTESETIASILEPLGADTFESSTMLYESIYGNVGDDHIGRKFYDDRGGTVSGLEEGPGDEMDVSF